MKGKYYSEGSLGVRFYDVVTSVDPSIAGDIEFYVGLLGSEPSQVLELGCGTGRVAIALAMKGHAVLGVDLSEPMLTVARAKSYRPLYTHLSNLSFLQDDMLKLDLPMRYNLVLLPYFTFNLLPTHDLRKRCLSVVAKHLVSNGHAVIHSPSLTDMRRAGDRRERKDVFWVVVGSQPDEPAQRLEVTWSTPAIGEKERRLTLVAAYELFSREGERLAGSVEKIDLWWFSDAELETSAKRAGLEVVRTLTSFGPGEGHQRIYVLRKLSPENRLPPSA